MSAALTWARGGSARILSFDGEKIALSSTVPSPPGSRIEGALADGGVVKVKIHASKRQDDGSFVLEGRALDMTRAVKLRIAESLGG